MGYLSREEQVVRGLEYLALSSYYLSAAKAEKSKRRRRRKHESAPINSSAARPHNGSMTTTMLAEFIYSLHGQAHLSQRPESAERQMRNHQKRAVQEFAELSKPGGYQTFSFQREACSRYFWDYKINSTGTTHPLHNDSAINGFVRSVGLRRAESLSLDHSKALLELIVLRYAIQKGLRLELKVNGSRGAEYVRCYALSLDAQAQQLMLSVYEPDRDRYRLLHMTDVEAAKDDLWLMVQKNVACPIVLSQTDADAAFRREERRLTVRMSRDYYPRFMRTLSGHVDLISSTAGHVEVQLRSFSQVDMEQTLYPHMHHVHIEPRAARDQLLHSIQKQLRSFQAE